MFRKSLVLAAAGLCGHTCAVAHGQCQPAWITEPPGPADVVRALTFYNGDLIAGGVFTQVAPGAAASGVARWDGQSWHPMGGGVSGGTGIFAMARFGPDLVVGGNFAAVGGTPANYVARWNGSWQPLGPGNIAGPAGGGVFAMCVDGNRLVLGGAFAEIAGVPFRSLAAWDGQAWTPIGAGVNGVVRALAVYNGELYVGGEFAVVGAASITNLARWNGSGWSAVSGGVAGGGVFALSVAGGSLYAAGEFSSAGGQAASRVARFDGSWHPMSSGVDMPARALVEHQGRVLVGGWFQTAGGTPAGAVAAWDGHAWSPLAPGTGGAIWALASQGRDLFLGGNFSAGPAFPGRFWLRWACPCYANCDGSTLPPVLNISDFTCFLNAYSASDPRANCDGSTAAPILNVSDFLCFLNDYTAGCP